MSYEVLYTKMLGLQNELFRCLTMLHEYLNKSKDNYAELENRLVNVRAVTEREIIIDDTIPGVKDAIGSLRYVKKHLLKSIETNYNTLINVMQHFKSTNVVPNDPNYVPIVKPTSAVGETSRMPTDIRYETPANYVTLPSERVPTVEESFRSLITLSTLRQLDDFVFYDQLVQLVDESVANTKADADGLTRLQAAAIVTKALVRPAETSFQLKVPRDPTPQFVRQLDAILFYVYQICRILRYSTTNEFLQQRIFVRRLKRTESVLQLNTPVVTPRLVGDVQDHLQESNILIVCQIRSSSIKGHFDNTTNADSLEESLFTDYPELWSAVQYESVPPLMPDEAVLVTNVVRFNSSTTINEYTPVPVDTENTHPIDVGFVDTFDSLQNCQTKFESLIGAWRYGAFSRTTNYYPKVMIDLNEESLGTLRKKIMIFTLVATSNMCSPVVGLVDPDRLALAQEVIEQMKSISNRQLYNMI
ncbi:ORF124 [Leucania separata nucleopolyhedrovirus]|uniref:ORF124 n=1 Tax=Leucania separata nucleopolyhedrovirus TaxID=1307956 RepID=Q0IKZ5_NPVLS|nr:ORF124 [Leucania separata nucleopolyhedrovirus]AAR28888.1 ORF124 [Leucania separata nucleopolyhedrovirus]